MHKKLIILFFLFSSLLFSEEIKKEEFNILAKNIETRDNYVLASGDVVIYSASYYISANRIKYDKKTENIELFENVTIIKDNKLQTQSNYAYLNLKNDSYTQTPLFLMNNKSSVWLNSKEAKKGTRMVRLKDTVVSSCDCVDPDWSIKVSSARYDSKSDWLHLYNPRLYLKNVPVLYSPYLGFSTVNQRETGLLTPTFGLSADDGIFYSQPIFWAPAKNYDFEFVPQIRENRGYGLYTYYRYIDSEYSSLKIKAGVFQEKDKYANDNNLDSLKHYGINIDYERTKVFSKNEDQDSLYISLINLNDIEYKTLEDDSNTISTEKKVESKINYFYNTPKHYTGIYGRYYIDTQLDSNKTTLQELPHIQWHLYNKEIVDKLIYSVDTRLINYTRAEGVGANIYKLDIPLSYSKNIFNDFLYFNIENKISLNKYIYNNSPIDYEDASIIQNETSFLIGTDLIKPYSDYLHTINLNAKYTTPDNIREDGDLYKNSSKDENKDLAVFPYEENEKSMKISLNQSVYDKNSIKQLINHRISQDIEYKSSDDIKLQDLENFLKFNFDDGSFTNKFIYNVQDKKIVENMYDLKINYNKLDLNLGYYNSKNTINSPREDLESYRGNISYRFARDYKLSYFENYNILEKVRNKQGLQFDIYDRCWNMSLKFEEELIPATSTVDDVVSQRIVYLNLELLPLGGINQKYKFKDK